MFDLRHKIKRKIDFYKRTHENAYNKYCENEEILEE